MTKDEGRGKKPRAAGTGKKRGAAKSRGERAGAESPRDESRDIKAQAGRKSAGRSGAKAAGSKAAGEKAPGTPKRDVRKGMGRKRQRAAAPIAESAAAAVVPGSLQPIADSAIPTRPPRPGPEAPGTGAPAHPAGTFSADVRLREKSTPGASLAPRDSAPQASDAIKLEPVARPSYAKQTSGAFRSIGRFPRPRPEDSRKKRPRREELIFPVPQPVSLGAIGMESEFTVLLDGQPVKPEDVFKSPTNIVRAPMIHRTGRSYHLPSGGAVYFDTGVIEIATGMIEIEQGCAARAGRSLWENIRYLRDELDEWEKRHGHDVELQGFSTHYNVSFSPTAKERRGAHRSVHKLALLLTYILPIPVMLLAANRRSTGVGVRPRGNRVEVTADFTPDAALMIATGTLCVGIIKAVMGWPSYELSELDQYARELPMIRGVKPVPHSSRKGWSAKYTCYPENPFIQDIDEPMWATTGGERLSLREMAGRITKFFWASIQRFSDPFTLRLIGSVMRGRAPSLLELEDRPAEYDSVGRLCQWDDLFPERVLPRSRYERVLGHAISGERLRLDREVYTPVGMQGWAHVVFRKDSDKSRHVLSLDYLLDHLDEWDSSAR